MYIPIFAGKGWEVRLKGSFRHSETEGDGPNSDYRDFLSSISGHENDTAFLRKQAETFIQSHPESFASAYVLEQYFIRTANPDRDRISRLMEPLTGRVKTAGTCPATACRVKRRTTAGLSAISPARTATGNTFPGTAARKHIH